MKMKENLVSIIVPVYNAHDYVERCILSLVCQTYKNIEILVINDGSTDDSLDVLNRLSEQYKMIKIINQKNSGVSSARNKGIEESNGDYLFFVDADDYIFDDCIASLLDDSLKYDADIVRCNYIFKGKKVLNFKNDHFYNLGNEKDKKIVTDLYINTYKFNTVWGQLIRKEIINSCRFDSNLKMGEDFKFNLDVLSCVRKIYVTQKCLYHYTYNVFGMNYNDSLDKIETKIKNLCSIYEYLYKNYDNTLVCKNYIKAITPQLLKLNEYKDTSVINYLIKQEIFVIMTDKLNISDLPKNKYYFAYIFVLKKQWNLLRIAYKFIFKPIKSIKYLLVRGEK